MSIYFFCDFVVQYIKKIMKKVLKPIRWRIPLWIRSTKEFLFRFHKNRKLSVPVESPIVIFFTGMPRTGSSLMKNFLGAYPGLDIQPFQPKGFFVSWEKSLNTDGTVLVDKSTHYIRHIEKIYRAIGNHVYVCVIVRDPRDQLSSLFDFPRHPELPRSRRFWFHWVKQYGDLLKFSREHQDFTLAIVRYEDLVSYPKQVKTNFLKWCGVFKEGAAIEDNYSIAHKNDIQDNKVVNATTTFTSSIGKFRTVTDETRRTLIYYYLRYKPAYELMRTFGYTEKGVSNDLTFSELPNITFLNGSD